MTYVHTLYGEVPESFFQKLTDIRLLVCDIDGVFSDGRIYMGNNGEEFKTFHTQDGYGVKALMKQGVDVAVVTGRSSNIVRDRMTSLGIKHIVQGREEKRSAVRELAELHGLDKYQIASVGDDMPDLGMFGESEISFSVSNGHPYVRQQADYVTVTPGGQGAVREICDLILQAHGALEGIHGSST